MESFGLKTAKHISSGSGFLWEVRDAASVIQHSVDKERTMVAGKGSLLFVENRSLSRVKSYGYGAAVVVKEPEDKSFYFGICLAVDLHSMSCLRWKGPLQSIDLLCSNQHHKMETCWKVCCNVLEFRTVRLSVTGTGPSRKRK